MGREVVAALLADERCSHVTVLVRRKSFAPHPKLTEQTVDFNQPLALSATDELYITLGTTIRTAGSQAAFRAVDFDAVLDVARAALAAHTGKGALRLAVVSAMGASPKSSGFYNRVKGEMEESLATLARANPQLDVFIARPSLLKGNRSALSQKSRPAEAFGIWAAGALDALIPKAYKAIDAAQVATALIAGARHGGGFSAAPRVALSNELQNMKNP